jgi:hypothetical protein
MTAYLNEDQAYEKVKDALDLCREENSQHSAVVVLVHNEKNTVRVYGLNMDESDVPLLLMEAAAEVGETVAEKLRNRTLN